MNAICFVSSPSKMTRTEKEDYCAHRAATVERERFSQKYLAQDQVHRLQCLYGANPGRAMRNGVEPMAGKNFRRYTGH